MATEFLDPDIGPFCDVTTFRDHFKWTDIDWRSQTCVYHMWCLWLLTVARLVAYSHGYHCTWIRLFNTVTWLPFPFKMAGDKYVPNGSTNGTKPPNGYLHSGLILHNGMKPPNGFKNTNGFKNSLNSLHSSGILTGSKGSVNGILRHKGEDQQMLKESEAFEDAISTESAESLRRRNIDSGYAWVVLLSAFMLNFFMSGQFGTLGIYLVEYFHYFDVGRAPISYIGACQMFVGYFLGKYHKLSMYVKSLKRKCHHFDDICNWQLRKLSNDNFRWRN